VRLIPASYVKAYVRRQKNDAADAAAICEAVTRPGMRFVPPKTSEQQSLLMLHRVRSLIVSQRTALLNALRGHLYEFGIVAAQGVRSLAALAAQAMKEDVHGLPQMMHQALACLLRQIASAEREVATLDRKILEWHRSNGASQRLATIPAMFRSGRELAAFFGLVPRQSSSGGKERLGRISKMGDRYIRTLLVTGATAVLRHARKGGSSSKVWAEQLLQRKPFKVAAVALANKTARIAWAVLVRGEVFRSTAAAA
jgi:transposase